MDKQKRTGTIADIEERAASTNDLLSDAEQSVVCGLLSEAEEDIKSLDEDILRLQNDISNLQKRRVEGLARIERLRPGIAPQKRIPPEILSKIFVCTLGEDALPLPPRPKGPIWNILWVCSRWRWIAIAEPIIWSRIWATNMKDREALNPLLHDIFANRGRGGLIAYHAPCVAHARAWHSLLDLISAYPSRFRHINVIFTDFFPPLPQAPPPKLDCLESINISFKWRYHCNSDAAPVADFFTSETLTKVAVLSYGAPPPSEWLNRAPLPWAQLTDLTIGLVPASVMESILKQCTCLAGCSVRLDGDLVQQDVHLHPILLEHLQSLTFHTASDFLSTEYLLGRLTVPALTNLSFGDQGWKKWPKESVLDLVARSMCALEVLITPQSSVEEEEVVPVMRALPNLTELHLWTKVCIADSTVDAIRLEALAPKLRKLHGLWAYSLLQFIRLLESRCTGEEGGECGRICEASVVIRPDHPDIYEGTCQAALMQLKRRGVFVDVFTV